MTIEPLTVNPETAEPTCEQQDNSATLSERDFLENRKNRQHRFSHLLKSRTALFESRYRTRTTSDLIKLKKCH